MKELAAAISLIYSIPVCRIVSLKEEKVFMAMSKRERFVLKLLPYSMEECRFITDAMDYLSNSGFHDHNEIIPTHRGKPCGEYRGYRTLLTKEVKGRVPTYKKKEDIRSVAICLGELHQRAKGFFPIHRFEQRNRWNTWIDTMEQGRTNMEEIKAIIAPKEPKTNFDLAYLHHCDEFIKETEDAIVGLTPFYRRFCEDKYKMGGFCHHDPAHHNFHIDQRGKAGVFDFDYVISDTAVHDVSALILKIAKTNHWNIEGVITALLAYNEINPLSTEEKELIRWMLKYPYDFHHAAFAHYYENNEQRRIEKKLFRQIHNVEQREAFLQSLNEVLREDL